VLPLGIEIATSSHNRTRGSSLAFLTLPLVLAKGAIAVDKTVRTPHPLELTPLLVVKN